jgi:hypothetical protein
MESELASAPDEWESAATPYLCVPAMDGTMTVRGMKSRVELGVDGTADLLMDHLQIGGLLHVEARKGDWATLTDGLCLDLEARWRTEPGVQPA